MEMLFPRAAQPRIAISLGREEEKKAYRQQKISTEGYKFYKRILIM